MKENSEVKFDIESFGNVEKSSKMIEAMKNAVFEICEKDEKFRNLHIGIAQEAVDKNLI